MLSRFVFFVSLRTRLRMPFQVHAQEAMRDDTHLPMICTSWLKTLRIEYLSACKFFFACDKTPQGMSVSGVCRNLNSASS